MKRNQFLSFVVGALLLVGCVADTVGLGGGVGTGGITGAGAGGGTTATATGGRSAPQTGGAPGMGGAPASPGGTGSTTGGIGAAADAGVPLGGGGASCGIDSIPAVVQGMLTSKCVACHGATPLAGASSLVTLANLKAPSMTDPTKTNAVVMLARIQSTSTPMPPLGGTPATAVEISALANWISANYSSGPCAMGSDAGSPGPDGGPVVPPTGPDPFGVGSVCTSRTRWTGGENASMNPGMACVSCHRSSGEGPLFTIAGTLYATGHEPDNCNGSNGASGARVVITGADGNVLTLTPNASGNFSAQGAVRMPYYAKVTFMGRERLMISTQTNGDCNACHTQTGASMAPGRIVLP